MLEGVFNSLQESPMYNVVFCAGKKDRILAQGRRRGMEFPYWTGVVIKRYHPELPDPTAGIVGPHFSKLSPHYPRKKKGSFFQKYKESHTPKSIKDP